MNTSTLMRRLRKERTEVNYVVKYLLFGFNSLIWIVGMVLLGIGIWATIQKNSLNNITLLTNKHLDPVLFFIVTGVIIFFIGFFGCIGALRENIVMLTLYTIALVIILLLVIIGAIMVIAMKDWVSEQILNLGVRNIIKNYREDPDLKNMVDWIQGDWLHCCGLEKKHDWESNVYFNCSSPGIDACGVPYSCCKPDPDSAFRNTQCGNGMLRKSAKSAIYTEGCLDAGKRWVSDQMVAIAGTIVAICFVLLLGICCSWNLRADVKAQMAKWKRI